MNKTVITIGALTGIIGIMMLLVPDAVVKTAVTVLGIAGIANGLYNIFSLRKMTTDMNFKRVITVRGALSITAGATAVCVPLIFAGTLWAAMLYVLGTYLILAALLEIYGVIKLHVAGVRIKPFVTEIISSIILAAILFSVPAAIGLTIIRIIGAALSIAGALFIAWGTKTATTVAYTEDTTEDE